MILFLGVPIPDSSGVIAGSVIAGIVVILCIGGAILAYLYYRRRKHIMKIKIMRLHYINLHDIYSICTQVLMHS